MEQIALKSIKKESETIEYLFSASDGLKQFFTDQPFVIECPESIEEVPDAVLAIPFVANVLPIIWLTDSELIVPELDEDFYNSISEFKKGYIDMYPDATFGGKVSPVSVEKNNHTLSGKSAAFFSAGLDAWCTLLRHLEEKPDLITIWGSDIPFDDKSGWETLHCAVAETAEQLHLKSAIIHSSFRVVINEGKLSSDFFSVLHDGWWHGVQHGIALIAHAAPYNYLHGISTQYIAASFSKEDGPIYYTCASYPTIDNYVRFCGCQVKHDAFITRLEKTKEVIEAHKRGIPVHLHVCWETTDGENCCHCEKCYRTMMGFWLQGEDPKEYGFNYPEDVYSQAQKLMELEYLYNPVIATFWKQNQAEAQNNIDILKSKPYWPDIQWILHFDFDHPEKNPERITYQKKLQKRQPLKQRLIVKMPWLYQVYRKIRRKG